MDIVFIKQLAVDAIVGIYDFERVNLQTVLLDIQMAFDNRPAAVSKNIEDALNYKSVADRIAQMVVEGEYLLVESMAEDIANLILEEFKSPWVKVEVGKPQALSNAMAVGVIVERGIRPEGFVGA